MRPLDDQARAVLERMRLEGKTVLMMERTPTYPIRWVLIPKRAWTTNPRDTGRVLIRWEGISARYPKAVYEVLEELELMPA